MRTRTAPTRRPTCSAGAPPATEEDAISPLDARTRAETVGSLLRPPAVRDAVVSRDPAASALVDDAVNDAIATQQDAGLDVITDGELRRLTWAETPQYFDCFARTESDGGLRWRGGTGTSPEGGAARPTYDVIVERLARARELGDRTSQYAYLVEHASARTKFTLSAPSYHRRYWSEELSRAAYSSCEEYLVEVRDMLRTVVDRLVELGCDYIQLDAPNYGSLCDLDNRARMAEAGQDLNAQLAFDAELDNSLFHGITGVTRALHICRGNAAGGQWHSTGGYGVISGELFRQLEFDRLLLEYDTERAGTFGPLADVKPGVVVVLGLLTTKTGQLEDEAAVRERIAEAAAVKPLDELALSTQCGFASVASGNPVTPEQQRRKLELVARVARATWGSTQ